ncbi:glycosyltransferase family 4 protein [Treponema sp. R80B11-R83G3]
MILEKSSKITILFLSWRDIKSPKMGGAEIYTHEMMHNADLNKFRIIHFSPIFEGAKNIENIDGIIYIRKGNLLNIIWKCRAFYKKNKDKIDFVVDQCNTFRFFTKFWVNHKKRIFLIFQLTREIWDFHLKFPFNKLGMLAETFMLKLNKNDLTITESESTKRDLEAVGFDNKKINIIPVGLNFKVWNEVDFQNKESVPTFIYVGRFAKYKGIDICINAFGELKKIYHNAKLWIVGKKDEEYINHSLTPICSQYNLSYGNLTENKDIIYYGFVTEDKKLELMSRAYILLVPSIREGWGMIITEAAAVGTPSIVFNSPGLIDAVNFGESGYIATKNNSQGILEIMENTIKNPVKYKEMRRNAHEFSKKFNWEYTGSQFTTVILNNIGINNSIV